VFLNCIYTACDIEPGVYSDINLPDVSKMLNAINSLSVHDLELLHEDNKLKYKSDDISFKVHLLEDGIITPPAVNIDKLKNIEFDTSFDIPYDRLQTLIKGSTFATDTNKVYFQTDNNRVLAELRDSDNEYINCFSSIVSESHRGNPITTAVPVTFEALRMILGIKFEVCSVHLSNKLNVFLFDISGEGYKINYIVSGLRR